jgi:teichuronic acid biosynthesis glycosyltransferase TuaC
MSTAPGTEFPHVLTLTPFYPTAADDANGCFVSEPLAAAAKMGVLNTVLAVQPLYRAKQRPSSSAPAAEFVRYGSFPGGIGLASAGAFLFASILARARTLHRDHAIHLIHAHAPLPCGHAAMLLAAELKIPFVVSVHGLDAYSTRQVKGRAGEWCRRISGRVFRSARNVICISEHVREQVLAGSNATTTVIYNGADAEMFSPSDNSAAAPVSVLSVGNLIPTKGHDALLRALAVAATNQPAIRLQIVGTGAEQSRLEMLAQELKIADRVRFLGRVPRREVARLLRDCTVFALPSTYEGLGCVYLEAMSTGKVAIGCRGQGIEEVIQNGTNGWLVDPGNVGQLAAALSTLFANSALRDHIGSHARQTILAGLTLQDQAQQLLRVYQESRA